jgi:excisionase family DNA binding protein
MDSPAVPISPLLDVRRTAERLGLSEKQVRRLIRRGELPALRVGAAVRVDPRELDDWLHSDPESAA